MRSIFNLFVFCTVTGIIAFQVYAFASSTSGAQTSGEGAVTISSWTISNVHYDLSEIPSLASSVSFDLNDSADNVAVKTVSNSSAFTKCTNIYAHHWQCDFQGGISISKMDELRIIATRN